jgi:hypothetical protein
MAGRTAQERRAAARDERRTKANQIPEVEDVVAEEAERADPGATLRTAASAALAAAAVGAAQALARRRHEQAGADDDGAEETLSGERPPEELGVSDEDTSAEDERPAREDVGREPEPSAHVPERREEDDEELRPVAPGQARQIVERAREQLRDLRGEDAESVSSIRRTGDGWRVGLEVVEVHRIPESTDVLATYEVLLDDDGDLLTFERTARYYRSEADRR